MVIKEALILGSSLLADVSESPGLDSKLLLEKALGCDRLYLVKNRDEALREATFDLYKSYIDRRCKNEPLAYITEEKEFMGFTFKVNENVLIPRPDTETLVEYAIENCRGKVLDIGTGSGAIAISLAKLGTEVKVSAVDVSENALEVAGYNAKNLGADVNFSQLDILKDNIKGKYDAVISNPPYIRTDVLASLGANVRDFEPSLALDGGSDGLIFYRTIAKKAVSALNDNGLIIFEIGFDQAKDVAEILEKDFSHIKVLYDLGNNPRVVTGRKK